MKQVFFSLLVLVMSAGAQAQPVMSTNLVSPGTLGIMGGYLGGTDVGVTWWRTPQRSRRIGIEWQTANLTTNSVLGPDGNFAYNERMSTERIGLTYQWRYFLWQGATDWPKGFYWGPTLHAGVGFVNRWHDNASRFSGRTSNYNMRSGFGLATGYVFGVGRLVIEPALRVGYLTYPAAPKHYFYYTLSKLDLLFHRLMFSRVELHIGYRF